MKERIQKPCIVVLAAGCSARLGRPKQLLAYGQESLVQHAVRTALAAGIGPVVVVTGAGQLAVENEIKGLPATPVFNPDWEEGMGASIRCGTEAAMELYPETDGLLMMVCDQPYVHASHLQHLWETQVETIAPIVASLYDEIRGTPVIYHESLFEELLALKGDQGARPLLQRHTDQIETVPFSEGAMDIDTEADYTQFLSKVKQDHS
jgi:molybdenum cofactor cytidylyltransferase